MAAKAGEVWGVEIVPESIADAERNAEQNKIENARFFAGSARTSVRPLIEQAGKPDVVVIDPPRAGLSRKIVRRLIECEAKKIVYVSCNPTTLAPNAAQLVEAGYILRRVKPVDMFPQTPHIECVALLEKNPES
jgi:23S rRNA (uracil1939-C5)-methyltransferase